MSFELVSIESITKLIYRYPSFYGMEKFDHGIPVIRGEHLNADGISTVWTDYWFVSPEYSAKYPKTVLEEHDIVMSVRGTVGTFCRVGRSHVGVQISPNLIRLVADPRKVYPQYFYYALRSDALRSQIIGSVASSAVPALKASDIKLAKICVPSKNVQIFAATALASLDDRITLLRETNATLEAIAQALFKSWFVDFDPVRAKMEGRAPEGMDEATAALFPDGLEESALGVVPLGWRTGRVDDLGEVVCGKTPPTSVIANYGNDVPFITIPDMHNLLAVTSTARSLSRLGAGSQKKKYLPPGAICVSCIATPGLVVRVTTMSQTNQQINSVIPLEAWGYGFPLFLLRRIGDAVRSSGSAGSVFHNLSKSGFEQLPVLLPTSELAQCFGKLIEPLIKKIIENQKQAETLATLRDTLLPRLISGQLRLPEAQAQIEERTP